MNNGLASEISKLALNRGSMNVEVQSNPSHRDSGTEILPKLGVHPPLFLSELESSRRVREFLFAPVTAKALDESGLTSTIKSSIFFDKFLCSKGRALGIWTWFDHGSQVCKAEDSE